MTDTLVNWFREASPYIEAHRDKVFVLYISGEAIACESSDQLINDVARISSLGIQLVIVHGAEPQISKELGKDSSWHNNIRVTSREQMERVQEVVGRISFGIQSRLASSSGLSTLQKSSPQMVITGNFVSAQPIGVLDGTDLQYAGQVRKINQAALRQQLANQNIVLISPLGASPSGEIFNLSSQELAIKVAITLQADKLICYIPEEGVVDEKGDVISEIQPGMMHQTNFLSSSGNEALENIVKHLGEACLKGVNRCHLISYKDDGALVKELFTRDGTGTQISRHSYEQIRSATIDDVGGILALIKPLEDSGVLIQRSRESLESEIQHFTLIERDGLVIACAALYPWADQCELACLAIHEDYRNDGKGDLILKAIEQKALSKGNTQIFVLTTQSTHWFKERGFNESELSCLPESKVKTLDNQRKSKVLAKQLTHVSAN